MVVAVNRDSQDAGARPLLVSKEAVEELRWFGDTENTKYPQRIC